MQSSTASNSLVILTRTKTDSQVKTIMMMIVIDDDDDDSKGRRHSVAVPLLAAPSTNARPGPDTCGYVIGIGTISGKIILYPAT